MVQVQNTSYDMSQNLPRASRQVHAAAGVIFWYLHEVSLQETFTRRNVMTTHKTKVAGLVPVQCRSLNPECIATLCKVLPRCAGTAAATRSVQACSHYCALSLAATLH